MKFADWKQHLHLDVLEPLVGTPREYSKHDIVDRTLRMLANIPRFSHDVTQMTIKLLPTITAETTSAAMDEFYLIFQQIDRHYWLQADSGQSKPIEVNLTGFPKKNGSNKAKATSAREHQSKFNECWNCGAAGHAFFDCPLQDDPVKQAEQKLKNALKKRNNTNRALATDTAANTSDDDDDNDDDDDDDDDDNNNQAQNKKQKRKFTPN